MILLLDKVVDDDVEVVVVAADRVRDPEGSMSVMGDDAFERYGRRNNSVRNNRLCDMIMITSIKTLEM
jgi:hypothetical protein